MRSWTLLQQSREISFFPSCKLLQSRPISFLAPAGVSSHNIVLPGMKPEECQLLTSTFVYEARRMLVINTNLSLRALQSQKNVGSRGHQPLFTCSYPYLKGCQRSLQKSQIDNIVLQHEPSFSPPLAMEARFNRRTVMNMKKKGTDRMHSSSVPSLTEKSTHSQVFAMVPRITTRTLQVTSCSSPAHLWEAGQQAIYHHQTTILVVFS